MLYLKCTHTVCERPSHHLLCHWARLIPWHWNRSNTSLMRLSGQPALPKPAGRDLHTYKRCLTAFMASAIKPCLFCAAPRFLSPGETARLPEGVHPALSEPVSTTTNSSCRRWGRAGPLRFSERIQPGLQVVPNAVALGRRGWQRRGMVSPRAASAVARQRRGRRHAAAAAAAVLVARTAATAVAALVAGTTAAVAAAAHRRAHCLGHLLLRTVCLPLGRGRDDYNVRWDPV